MSQILHTLSTLASDPNWLIADPAVHTHAVDAHTQVLAADPNTDLWAAPDADGEVVPDVVPEMPDEVSGPVGDILNWTAGLGLAGAVLGGLLGWAAVAIGHNSERAALAARGKQGILWSLFGAGGIGVTSALVLAFYNMGA